MINGCKTFEKIELSKSSFLSHFLVDDDLNGDGKYISSALKPLANVQNKILKLCSTEENKLEYPIQSLQPQDIIIFSLTNDDLTAECSVNSLEYSMGKEVIYDFDRFQLNLSIDLRNKKLLNAESLNTMQYQFELLNSRGKYSGIISEIRNNIPQFNLPSDFSIILENTITQIARTNSKDIKCIYKEIYSSLDKILCFIRQLKNYENQTIETIFHKMNGKLSRFLIENNTFPSLSLRYIISFYENIENKCYPFIVEYIGPDYRIKIEDLSLLNYFKGFIENMNEKEPNLTNELHNVLKRIILRLLTANIEPSFSIAEYLENESLWNQEYLANIENIIHKFPKEFKLLHAVCLENVFTSYKQKTDEPKIVASDKKTKPAKTAQKGKKPKAKF